jgi:hypothetical protein
MVAIFAFLILGRTVDPAQWSGIVLIVVAVLVMQLSAAGCSIRGRWRGERLAGPNIGVDNSGFKDVDGT